MKKNKKIKTNKVAEKNCSCWLKGGIIGVAIFVVFALITLLTKSLTLGLIGETLEGVYLVSDLMSLTGWAYSIVVWFVLGALVGWIIGKLKAKKARK